MTKNYYKIGEFSKLTGVSIKSLRYYDAVGVLKPAYIDRQTNYRFYVPEQMIQLDVIKLCLSFDIPLKSTEMLKSRNAPDLKKLIYKGKEKAREQLLQAKRMLRLSDDLLIQTERLSQKRDIGEIYTGIFESTRVLVTPWDRRNDTDETYLKKIAKLRKSASDRKLTVLTQQGILIDYPKKQSYVYVSVFENCSDSDIIEFKKGTRTCMMLEESKLSDLSGTLKSRHIEPKFVFCLNTDIYDFCLEHNLHLLEAQCVTEE